MNKFNFWKENKIDQHFTLTETDLVEKFKEWLSNKQRNWLDYYTTHEVLCSFIGETAGLSSVQEPKEMDAMVKLLKPIKQKYLQL